MKNMYLCRMNKPYPWSHQRRMNMYVQHLKASFDTRIQKLSIDAGFTCPNRDGHIAYGGCSFCSNDAFRPSYCTPEKSILQQIEEGKVFHQFRYRRASKYLAYFQAYSNTYAPLDILKERFEAALSDPDVIGLVIGTRPDCLPEPVLDYLAELSQRCYLVLEIGVESCSDETLALVNRGHDIACAVDAIKRAASKGLRVGTHWIIGFPNEKREALIDGVNLINSLPIFSIKFHQLQVFKDTPMARLMAQYQWQSPFRGMTEYLELLLEIIERLRPDIFIERIAGEVPPRFLEDTPDSTRHWGEIRYDQVLVRFERLLESKQTWQGRCFSD